MSECVTIVLQGGIGNQLFQYCAGLAIAAKTGGELWLTPTQENKHSGRDYRSMLYIRAKAIGIDDDHNVSASAFKEQKGAYEAWDPSEYSNFDSIMLKGYFQYLPAIESQLRFVREDILQRLSAMRAIIRKKYEILNSKQTCFLHVRRGDYLKLDRNIFWIQDEAYYMPALQALKQRSSGPKRWFVLSDDTDWCKQQSWLTVEPFEIVDETDELVGLMLMSMCEGGAVISNSTYSWWGAMLGCAATGAPVTYPAKWNGTEKPNLFLPNWIRI